MSTSGLRDHLMSDSLDASIRELFAALLRVPVTRIDDHARPATIETWDSMQHLMLVSGFEEEFSIDVDPEEAVDMYESFAAFRRIVLAKLEQRR